MINKLSSSTRRLCSMAVILTLCGCNTTQYDPNYWHSGFVAGLKKHIGKKITDVRGGWANREDLVSRIELANRNVAYKYRYQGTCRYTFEVDPKTDLIVAVSWEGEARHCAIVP